MFENKQEPILICSGVPLPCKQKGYAESLMNNSLRLDVFSMSQLLNAAGFSLSHSPCPVSGQREQRKQIKSGNPIKTSMASLSLHFSQLITLNYSYHAKSH